MTDYIQVGTIGLTLTLTITENDTALNISAATTKQILICKPSGALMTKTAIFVTDGTDGKLKYVTVSGDLDEPGEYQVQASVITPSLTGKSSIDRFTVRGNLA